MAIAIQNYNDFESGAVIVPAQAGLVIRVERLLVTSWVGMALTLLSDPGGAEEQAITAALRIMGGSVGVFDFAGKYAISTARGTALGLSSFYQSTSSAYGVMVWYEYVP